MCFFNILREITDVTITMIGSLVVLSTLIRKLLFIFIIVITNTTIVCFFPASLKMILLVLLRAKLFFLIYN